MSVHLAQHFSTRPPQRRVVAVVLNQLLCELAAEQHRVRTPSPLAVVLTEEGASPVISAVNAAARTHGVRVGQTVPEACAWLASLCVVQVSPARMHEALVRVAESLWRFAPVVSLGAPDTIWLDVTGVAHLFEGEKALLAEIASSVAALGHFSRLAVAGGPLLAQAFARWHPIGRQETGVIVEAAETVSQVGNLPLQALPVPAATRAWLAQLGLVLLADLARLPRDQLGPRLGADAPIVLDLLDGRDDRPLVAHRPAPLPRESLEWEESVTGREPLWFALRGLASRLGARLEGRGLAASALRVTLQYDRLLARARGLAPEIAVDCPLAAPLYRPDDLWRIVTTALERVQLAAPSVGLALEVTVLVPAPQRQLDLSTAVSRLDGADPGRLQVLFSELAAELGPQQFGTLQLEDSHRPEKISRLRPVVSQRPEASATKTPHGRANAARSRSATERPRSAQTTLSSHLTASNDRSPWQPDPETGQRRVPNRLLPSPVSLPERVEKGALVAFGGQLYSIAELTFEYRLDGIEWWSGERTSRDYSRASLVSEGGRLEALIYRNRLSGQWFLQAIYD